MVGMFLVFNVCIKALQTIQTNKQFKTWNMILMCKQFRHRETWNLVATCSLETQPGFASQLFALKEIELYSNIKQISRLKMVASSVLLCGTNLPGWDPYSIPHICLCCYWYEIWWDQLTGVGPIDWSIGLMDHKMPGTAQINVSYWFSVE